MLGNNGTLAKLWLDVLANSDTEFGRRVLMLVGSSPMVEELNSNADFFHVQ